MLAFPSLRRRPLVSASISPITAITVVVIALFMWRKTVPRWGGAVLVALYVGFIAGGYLVSHSGPGLLP